MDLERLPDQASAPRRHRGLWLLTAGLLLALGLGVGTLVGALATTPTQVPPPPTIRAA